MKVNQKLFKEEINNFFNEIPTVEIDARFQVIENKIYKVLKVLLSRLLKLVTYLTFFAVYLIVIASIIFFKFLFILIRSIYKNINYYLKKTKLYNWLNTHRNKITYISAFSIVILIMLFEISMNSNSISRIESNRQIEYIILRDNLYKEIDSYLGNITPEHNLNIYNLIDLCIKQEYNIGFLLTQAQLESHFGTKGEAIRTNSMFNVIWCKFDDINDSVEPYIDLMKRRYLSDGRSYDDLLDNFTDIYGKRYAEDKRYEPKLKTIYTKINKETNIISLSQRLQQIERLKTAPYLSFYN